METSGTQERREAAALASLASAPSASASGERPGTSGKRKVPPVARPPAAPPSEGKGQMGCDIRCLSASVQVIKRHAFRG